MCTTAAVHAIDGGGEANWGSMTGEPSRAVDLMMVMMLMILSLMDMLMVIGNDTFWL